MRLVQLLDPELTPRVAVVDGSRLRLLEAHESVYHVALSALEHEMSLQAAVESAISAQAIDYDPLYHGYSDWRIRPAFNHPEEPSRCLVSGTGLTHKASAQNREAMHTAAGAGQMTDSMRMYQWGEEGGQPAPGEIGVQPEWFYKGCGLMLRGHGEPLVVPAYADDGGEEAEVAGCYLIDWKGCPRRIGFATGNEFSDHVMERKNYLYLAPSKLRTCAVGPELIIGADFGSVNGSVSIERAGTVVWTKTVATGEAHMSHTLSNLEHHHFKYVAHRRPGDVHVHFYGASAFSFGEGVALEDGDHMTVEFEGFGRALRNPLRIDRSDKELVEVKTV